MKKKGMVGTILAAVLVIALAVILVVSYIVLKNYVVTGGQLFARNQACCLQKIRGELFEIARAPRIIAGGLNAVARAAILLIEAGNVVALPAVNRNRLALCLGERGFNVHAHRGVNRFCAFKSFHVNPPVDLALNRALL